MRKIKYSQVICKNYFIDFDILRLMNGKVQPRRGTCPCGTKRVYTRSFADRLKPFIYTGKNQYVRMFACGILFSAATCPLFSCIPGTLPHASFPAAFLHTPRCNYKI